MNIFRYFQKSGINTPDETFYRKIDEWKIWYNGNVRKFSWYKVYTGNGTYVRKQRKTLGMAKKLCEDLADMLLNEKVKITIADETTHDFVAEVLRKNNFEKLGNQFQERKCFTGTVAYVPYLKNMEVAEDGSVVSGEIGINYLQGSDIYPVSWNNGRIAECVFRIPVTYLRKQYYHLQYHRIERSTGMYVIQNIVLESIMGLQDGRELSPEEWHRIAPFEYLEPIIETGSDKPQFSIDTLNIVNNADEDETNPMGISLFANVIPILKTIDVMYDSYCNEFELGKKRVMVAPEMMQNIDGTMKFDPEDTLFYQLPEDFREQNGEKGFIKELDMNLRADEHSRAINDNLQFLSLNAGFGTNRYQYQSGQIQTATQVISVNSDMYRMIRKHEISLEASIKDLVNIIIRLGTVLGYDLVEDPEITIDFDDSIIIDEETERNSDRQDVSMGAMTVEEYRSKWYGEPLEEAQKNVQEQAEVIE